MRRGPACHHAVARVEANSVTTMPANRLMVTARPSRLQPVRPKNASGANSDQPPGPSRSHTVSSPRASTSAGTSSSHIHSATAAAMPSITARGGVCGRHSAKPSAGASAPSAENDSAPTSANASLPAISRL